jgi:HPt (histidine-containing phosphotransfer) domain-containing protein
MEVSVREAEILQRFADIAGPNPGAAERALLARLIRSFLGKTPPAVDRLGDLLRTGDPAAVCDHAHSLKGSASNLGAGTLAAIFAEVEYAARDGAVADPAAVRARAGAELTLITGVLERLAGQLDPAPPAARAQ